MKNSFVFGAVAAMLAFAGCDKEEPADYGGFSFEVSDLTPSCATVRIQPDNPGLTYLSSYFDTGSYPGASAGGNSFFAGTDLSGGMQQYVDHMLEELEKTYPELTRGKIVSMLVSSGAETKSLQYLKPGAGYSVYAVGLDAQGKLLTEVFTEELTTLSSEGVEPRIELTLRTGDDGGGRTSSYMTGEIRTTGALYGRGYFGRKRTIDSLAGKGYSEERLLGLYGREFPQAELDRMNAGTMRYSFGPLLPATEYVFTMTVVSEGGLSVIASAGSTTEQSGTAALCREHEEPGVLWSRMPD